MNKSLTFNKVFICAQSEVIKDYKTRPEKYMEPDAISKALLEKVETMLDAVIRSTDIRKHVLSVIIE